MKIVKKQIDDDNEKETKNNKLFYKRWRIITAIILIIIVLLFNYKYSIVFINGHSMEPNYNNHNIVLAEKHYEYLTRFDVVVINSSAANKLLIKRIIGQPGEVVEYSNNQLFINGEYVADIYADGWTDDFIIELDENSYFCIGDNRENSYDSRYYGAFNSDELIAKVKGRQHVKLFQRN